MAVIDFICIIYLCKAKDFQLIRNFVRKMNDSESKIVNGQIFKKQQILGLTLRELSVRRCRRLLKPDEPPQVFQIYGMRPFFVKELYLGPVFCTFL